VGPYLSGKTTLLEAILFRTGAIPRQGKVSEGNTVADASPEARAQGMSVDSTSPPRRSSTRPTRSSTAPARSNSPRKRAMR
jgi:hypothetical protein